MSENKNITFTTDNMITEKKSLIFLSSFPYGLLIRYILHIRISKYLWASRLLMNIKILN